MKRNSPFVKNAIYEKDLLNKEDCLQYVSNNPSGYISNIVLVYANNDARHHHMTILFKVVATSDVGLILKLYHWIKLNIGKTIRIKLSDEADFTSHIYPEAKIMRVLPLLDESKIIALSTLIRSISGYEWKPHITFKTGKVFEILELNFELWFGYMRQDLVQSNGKSILDVISPLERELQKVFSFSDDI